MELQKCLCSIPSLMHFCIQKYLERKKLKYSNQVELCSSPLSRKTFKLLICVGGKYSITFNLGKDHMQHITFLEAWPQILSV